MASLKSFNDRKKKTEIVELINKAGTTRGYSRGYLGMSGIGGKCMRAQWLDFRFVKEGEIDGNLNRLFGVGHKAEADIIKDLESIGIETWDTLDAQAGFSDISGYFRGHGDGVGKNIPGAEKTDHLLEFKTVNQKGFDLMVKEGVEKSKPVYYAQMIIYMHYSKLNRALFVMMNKNNSHYYIERVKGNEPFAKELIRKAQDILFTEDMNDLPRIGNNTPSWYECRWCNYSDVCFGKVKADDNCRTCSNCDMVGDSKFICSFYDKELSLEDQKKRNCKEHIYLECFK